MLKLFDKRQSVAVAKEPASESVVVGNTSIYPIDTLYVRTRRSKCLLNIALEDFSRIHVQFSEKTHPLCIETAVFSLFDNEKIKFQFRLLPAKHDLRIDAIYRGSESSGNLFIEVYLLDKEGHKFPFEYGRKIDIQVGSRITESLNNYVYDRDELEKKREKLFANDKLVVCIDLMATWCEISDKSNE
jgi:hypothetical protein